MRRLLLALALVVAVGIPSAAQVDALLENLNPTGHVNDFAGVAGGQRQAIESLLVELEQKTGAEVAIVTIRSLDGGDIDDFAVRLFERWGIGQADEDNGLLLIAAVEDQDVRIEVGYGLEPVINDALAGRVLDQAVVPYFREGDYASGLAAGAAALASLIAEEAGVQLTGTAAVQLQPPSSGGSRLGGWLRFLFLLLLIPILWRNPWLALLLLSGGRGGFSGGGGFGRGGGGGFGGFGGGMSGGGGASRSW